MLENDLMGLELPPPRPLAGRLGTSLLTSQSLFLSITTSTAETPNTAITAITMPATPPPLRPCFDGFSPLLACVGVVSCVVVVSFVVVVGLSGFQAVVDGVSGCHSVVFVVGSVAGV